MTSERLKFELKMLIITAAIIFFVGLAYVPWKMSLAGSLIFVLFVLFVQAFRHLTARKEMRSDGLIIVEQVSTITVILIGFALSVLPEWFIFIKLEKGDFANSNGIFLFCIIDLILAIVILTNIKTTIIGFDGVYQSNRNFGYRQLKNFRLKDLKEIKISIWGLKLIFNSGKKLKIASNASPFYYLKPYKSKIKNRNMDGLYRLKQEIEERASATDLIEGSDEVIPKIKFSIEGLKTAVVIFLVSIIVAGPIFYSDRVDSIENLKSKNPQSLRLNNFKRAFFYYQGREFKLLSENYIEKCRSLKDYNCRLAAYFKFMNNDVAGELDLVKRSCSEDDPQSCYIILINKFANSSDKEMAIGILNKACSRSENKFQVCCKCYADLKK